MPTKTRKFFLLEVGEKTHYCYTLSAAVDILQEKGNPLKPYRLWRLSKEIGDVHTFEKEGVKLTVLPLICHSNPNKGGDRTLKSVSNA